MDDGFEIKILRTVEEIEGFRLLWQELQDNQLRPVPNTDIDRYFSLLKSQKERMEPFVMVFTFKGRPVSMVVGRIEMHRLRCRIGYKVLYNPLFRCFTVVYGGVLGDQSKEISTKIITEIQSLLRSDEVDMVYFNQLQTDSMIYRVAKTVPGFLCRGHFQTVQYHRSMSIPESMELFYQSRSKKHRSNLRRYIRKLEKEYPGQTRIASCNSEDGLEEVMQAASEISTKTYQSGLGRGFVVDNQTRSLMSTAARSGWLRSHVLFVGQKPCAFQIGLHYGKSYFLEQIGYDPAWKNHNVGTILFLNVLSELCGRTDLELLDFGFGDAEYKRIYGDHKWQEVSVYVFACRLRPLLINTLQSTIAGIGFGLKYVVDKANLTGYVKRSWRNRLQENTDSSKD